MEHSYHGKSGGSRWGLFLGTPMMPRKMIYMSLTSRATYIIAVKTIADSLLVLMSHAKMHGALDILNQVAI